MARLLTRKGASLRGMEQWDLTSLAPSTEKETPRAPGPHAPRVPRADRQMPRVLFSTPECRAVAVDLGEGESMGNHRVHERAVVQVLSGRVAIEASGESADCGPGTLVRFDRSEEHSVRALVDSRLLLILAPWPGRQHLPPNATVDPAP